LSQEKEAMSIQALREKLAAKAQELNTLVNNKDEKWDDSKQSIYDTGMAEIDDLKARITRITDLNTRVAEDALNAGVIDAAERIGTTRSPTRASCSRAGCAGAKTASRPRSRSRFATPCRPRPTRKAAIPSRSRSPTMCSTRSRPSAACEQSRP
jgi:hypothetical protein